MATGNGVRALRTPEQATAINEIIIPACREDGDNYSVRVWKGHVRLDGLTRLVVQYHGDDTTDIERIWWVAPSGQYTWNQPSASGKAVYPWT